MLTASIVLNLVLAATVWRLKGTRTVRDIARIIIQGGGGPGEEGPKK